MTDEVNISQPEYEIYQGWFVSHRFFRRVSFTLGIPVFMFDRREQYFRFEQYGCQQDIDTKPYHWRRRHMKLTLNKFDFQSG